MISNYNLKDNEISQKNNGHLNKKRNKNKMTRQLSPSLDMFSTVEMGQYVNQGR